MIDKDIIEKVKEQVFDLLQDDDTGHDPGHIRRVLDLSLKFAEKEGGEHDLIVLLTLLHDVDDYKLFGLDNIEEFPHARQIMTDCQVPENLQERVCIELANIGYSKRLKGRCPLTIEGKIVSDADMCDALGANGIIRILTYHIKNKTPFFQRDIFPKEHLSSEQYTSKCADTGVCHMFEKILKLKNLMLTESGKAAAVTQHQITEDFLRSLFQQENAPEWIEHLDSYVKNNDRPADPVVFRMYARIRFNRPIDREKDDISPGGYTMVMGGQTIQFDFEDYSGSVESKDNTILDIEQKNPYYESFGALHEITAAMLENVTEINEFFVYTGEPGETDLRPAELLELVFVLPDDNWRHINVPREVCAGANLGSNICEDAEWNGRGKHMTSQTIDRKAARILFDWTGLDEKDLAYCNARTERQEDEIIGFVPVKIKGEHYIIDIHYEYHNSREKGFGLELFRSNDEKQHLLWLGSIKDIKSARNYKRFRHRAEVLVMRFMKDMYLV